MSARFHLKPGTAVIVWSVDASGVNRIVCTPMSRGFGADVATMWPKLSSHRPSTSPLTVTRPVAAIATAPP